MNGNLKCSDYFLPWLLAFSFSNRLIHLSVLNPSALVAKFYWVPFIAVAAELLFASFIQIMSPYLSQLFLTHRNLKDMEKNLSDCITN